MYLLFAVEMPSVLLMAAIRNVHIARPTIYQVVKEMIDKMGYEVKLVRVNKRIQEAYCAELYLTKTEYPTDSITFDLRPSDAINIAVRCKVYLLFLFKVLLDVNSLSSMTFSALALLFVSIVAFLLILDQLLHF